MSIRDEIRKLESRAREVERAIQVELMDCRKRKSGEITKAHANLRKEAVQIREEIARLEGGTPYNPMNLEHGERMTVKKVVGDLTKKTGPDTRYRLGD